MIRAVLLSVALNLPAAAFAQQSTEEQLPPEAQNEPQDAATTTDLRRSDAARMAAFDTSAGQAILQAMAGGSRGDVDLLQDILFGVPLAPIATTLPGRWSCRTLKLGGGLNSLVVYAPFDCTISADGVEFMLEKTTGSQRLTGRIALIDGQMILTGTGYVADIQPIAYADLPPDFVSDGTIWPIVGRVEQVGPDHIRILMPQPALESNFDILDLRRQD